MRGFILACGAAAALAAPPAPASAQFRPVGTAVPIDSQIVAMDAAGNLVAVWQGQSHLQIYARLYDAGLVPLGEPFVIHNDSGAVWVDGIDVVRAPQGHFAVTFMRTEAGVTETRFKLFNADGTLRAQAALGRGDPWFAHGAADASGNIVFLWRDEGGVRAEAIDPSGTVRVAPRRVDWDDPGTDESNQHQPLAVVAEWSGGFTVFWREGSNAPSTHAQRYDRTGAPLGSTFSVEATYNVAASPSGDFVVVWRATSGPEASVWARRYSTSGSPYGAAFQVSDVALANCADIRSVAMDARGEFVVTWEAYVQGPLSNVYARRYHADGTAYGPSFPLTPSPNEGTGQALVTCEPTGHCVFTFYDAFWLRAQRHRVQPRERPVKGDFDGDGQTDLILRNGDSGAVRLWLMGEGVRLDNLLVWPAVPPLEWALVGSGDFDGDGHNDLVYRHGVTGALSIWRLGGESGNQALGSSPVYNASPMPAGWDVVATGDFTFDGWPDLVWQDRVSGQIQVWPMAGTLRVATLVPMPAAPPDPDWIVVGAQDWNVDGTRDLLLSHGTSGQLMQWLLDPVLRVVAARSVSPPAPSDSSWRVVATGDYGVGPWGTNGTPDIVWRHEVSGRQIIWFLDFAGNRTAGVFTQPLAPSNPAWVACGPR